MTAPGLTSTQVPLHDDQGHHRAHSNNRHRLRSIETPEGAIWEDYLRGARDIGYFAERWLGIKGHPGQLRWWAACAARSEDNWSPKYLTTVVSSGNRSGKEQHVDEPVLTPSGWRRIGDLRPGDAIFAGDGSQTTVAGIFPQGRKSLWRLTFDDGAQTVCGAEHLWTVKTPVGRFRRGRSGYGETQTLSLRELRERYGDTPPPIHRWSIPAPGPIQYPARETPIEPYLLGCLLGDGHLGATDVNITQAVDGIDVRAIADVRRVEVNERGTTATYYLNDLYGPLRTLGLLGKRSWEKGVPRCYMENESAVRLAVLQGLMDTDGTASTQGAAYFYSTSRQLALDVQELARSLGAKARIHGPFRKRYAHRGEVRTGRDCWRVSILVPTFEPFRLPVKQNRMATAHRNTSDRVIHRIERVEDGEAVCIQVAHPSQLYITRDFIVTHNTLAMAVVVLHHTLYKLGLRPPRPGDVTDAERWVRAPYQWYHVAPTQGQAELVHQDLARILSGSHLAQQGRGCPLIQEFPGIAQWDRKYRGEYLWIIVSPLFGGGEIHFRTTQEKAKALLGIDMNGISFDEAAFELYLSTIHEEVLNLRRLSTGGPLHYIGTPTEGTVEYRDIWLRGDPDDPDRDPRVLSFRLSTRDNVGYGITPENFEAILRQQADYLIPQNIDGYFIEAQSAYFTSQAVEAVFDNDLPEEAQPLSGHRYSQAVDPGVASDASVALTLDYTTKPWDGVRIRRTAGHQTLPAIVNMVREGHLLYNASAGCTTTVDSTGLGGKMFIQEFSIIRPLRAFDFAGTKAKKLELLSDLKTVIEKGWLRLPKSGPWARVRRELLAYRLDDRRIEQDCVMALAMSVKHAIRNPTVTAAPQPFEFF